MRNQIKLCALELVYFIFEQKNINKNCIYLKIAKLLNRILGKYLLNKNYLMKGKITRFSQFKKILIH